MERDSKAEKEKYEDFSRVFDRLAHEQSIKSRNAIPCDSRSVNCFDDFSCSSEKKNDALDSVGEPSLQVQRRKGYWMW